MDILTHMVSGMAVGTVVASFSEENKAKIILASAFAGALPDIDTISLWSGFDGSIGKLFDLPKGRDIYSAKYWYSHHGFMHSIVAGIVFALFFGVLGFLINRFRSFNFPVVISFFLAFLVHLIQDMPTPSATWEGIRLLFPFNVYFGGSGKVWWWNNYDIFLIALSVLFVNLLSIFMRMVFNFKAYIFTSIMFILGVSLMSYQINTRNFDFNYEGHTKKYQEYEKKSKEIQKKILGKNLFYVMEQFDNSIKIYF